MGSGEDSTLVASLSPSACGWRNPAELLVLSCVLSGSNPEARRNVAISAASHVSGVSSREPVIVSCVTSGDRQPVDGSRESNRVLEVKRSGRLIAMLISARENVGVNSEKNASPEGQEHRSRRRDSSLRPGTPEFPTSASSCHCHPTSALFLALPWSNQRPLWASPPKSGPARNSHADSIDSSSPDRG